MVGGEKFGLNRFVRDLGTLEWTEESFVRDNSKIIV